MKNYDMQELGWDKSYENEFNPYRELGLEPARIIAEHKGRYIVAALEGEMPAEVTGKFIYSASSPAEYPKTGDWVAVSVIKSENKALICNLLSRRTFFSRKESGKKAQEQIIAANINTIFIVQGLDGNYNKMRLLRYAASLKNSGITPIVILNKADINPEAEHIFEETKKLLSPIYTIKLSAKTGEGMDALKKVLQKTKTFAFVGSSGAGKSTIINSIADEDLAATGNVRDSDSRGRHVTVTRQLYMLGKYGMLIDTPGMREFQLWNEEGREKSGFEAIEDYSKMCRYKNCTHENEPGCAVKKAVESGEIAEEIMKSHFKLLRELDYAISRTDKNAALKRKNKGKNLSKTIKKYFESTK
jgi:ribosome biogenesis GTPase / thiamine phosphate phosphatase